MSYQDFEAKWLDGVTDTDGYPKGSPYQCADLIKRYMHDEFGVPLGTFGNAADYWHHTHPVVLDKFVRVASDQPKQGDLVVLRGINGNIFGHIGISTRDWVEGDTVEILEQNGSTGNGKGQGKDKIRKRSVPRSRILGLLRPIVVQQPSDETYTIIRDVTAYYTSTDAAHHMRPRGTVRPRTYAIFNKANGMINVTTQAGSPGSWINPEDNKVAEPTPPPQAPAPAPTPPQPRTYTVKSNDNLSSIARAHGLASWRPLYEKNRAVIGDNPNIVRPGQVLVIP